MGISQAEDEAWMRHAIRLAQHAQAQGEVPVGAVLVLDNEYIAEGWNASISNNDPTAHAEIMAMRLAGQRLDNYRLPNYTLYVSLEPCVMCMGAIAHARIKRLVFGAIDKKRGAVCSALELANAEFLNHRLDWQGEVLAETCSHLLRDFFKAKRKNSVVS